MVSPDITNNDLEVATTPKQIERLIQALSGVHSLTNIRLQERAGYDLYQHILKSILNNIDSDSCSIFLNKDGVFKCAAGLSWGDHSSGAILRLSNSYNTFQMGEGILGLCAEQKSLIHCKDCQNDERFVPLPIKNNETIGSLISAPLISCDELIGVINVSHPQVNYFEPWHEKVLISYANIVAQMLHHHGLIHAMDREINKQTKDLKLALKESDELRKRYQELSFVDYLTEIHNRRYFFPEFASSIANAQRHKHTVSLMILDLDLFKSINDNYGHELGDAVLIGVTQLLKRQVRKGDILARLGGEEFAIALIGTDIESAKQFADRLRIMINELEWSYQNQTIRVSISIGLSSLDNLNSEPDEAVRILMSEADIALYSCKRSGRNMVMSYGDMETIEGSRNIS